MSVIEGTAYWAKVIKADQKYKKNGGGIWSIEVANLSKETRTELKELGLQKAIKNLDDDRDFFITLRRNENRSDKDKTAQDAPVILDSQNNIFEGAIGNGSKVRVQFRTYDYDGTDDSGTRFQGTSTELTKVQVIELVEYETDDADTSYEDTPFEVVDGGFVVKENTLSENASVESEDDIPFELDEESVAS